MKNTNRKKTALSLIACLALVFALLPTAAMAEDNTCLTHSVAYNNGFCPSDPSCYEPCGGSGTAENPYTISNAGQLYWFAQQVNNGSTGLNAVLTVDIVVNPGIFAEDGTYTPADGESLRDWTRIGNSSKKYTGIFDGNGKTVSGLYYNNSGTGVGLFGYVGNGGTVKNVGVIGSYIRANQCVGGVVGSCESATITNCYNTGTVVSGSDHAGGVVGYSKTGITITNCYNTGTVRGGDSTGGVVGSCESATITNCYNTGTVAGSNAYVGGVVGSLDGSVTNCYNTGNVSGFQRTGGVVGYGRDDTVTNCYNTGTVSVGKNEVGGVLGYGGGNIITNCYNVGTISFANGGYEGGVVGKNAGTTTNCYYLDTCGAAGAGTPKTAEDFASGEVAYLLNGSTSVGDLVWGQDLDNNKPAQTAPTFDGATVYYGFISCADDAVKVYTNNATAAEVKPEHSGGTATCVSGKICEACGTAYGEMDTTNHNWTVTYTWSEDGKACTATHICGNDASHNETATATVTSEVTREPTCTDKGETTYTATFTEDWADTQTKVLEDVAATDHDWTVTYTWSEDGKACTATHICGNDASHNETATATVTSEVTREPTCTDKGETTYTATFTEDWADTQTKVLEDVAATDHDWTVTYTWSEDGKACTATHICGNDASHNETATATVTSEVTREPTETEKGETTYTATFDVEWAETQTKTIADIPVKEPEPEPEPEPKPEPEPEPETPVEDCDGGENCPVNAFADLDSSAWYHHGIHFCVESGLMNGVSDTEFAPNGVTTRAQIVVILWRLAGKPTVNYQMQFEDVEAESWYTEAVRWAASENIVGGYGNGRFGPNDPITRQQMAVILYRYCQYSGIDVSAGEDTNILSYTDAFSISEWAIPAMQWACGSGMIQGIADGSGMKLDPSGSATRAQVATVLWRFCTEIMEH